MTWDLAEELKDTNVIISSLHPGTVRTDVFRYMFANKCYKYCFVATCCTCIYFFMKSPVKGA